MNPGTRVAIAAVAATIVVLAAPFTQLAVDRLASANRYQTTAAAATVAPIVLVFLYALFRIRDRRALRYGALVAAAAIGTGYVVLAELSVGEAFHFAEYGGVALAFFWACRPLQDRSVLVLPILATIIAGIADEWYQWFIPLRAGEARDVTINAVAGLCGVLAGIGIAPPSRPWASSPAADRRMTICGGIAAASFVLFFYCVHTGYDIVDPAAGTFRSRYPPARLDAIAAARAVEWRTNPPRTLRRVSREDQYLTEGGWHAQERNRAFDAGDIFRAWRENLILERHYAPVLDAPSYTAPSGHRWSAEQRADAQTRSGDFGQAYFSEAQPFPVYALPAWLAPLFLLKLLLVPALVTAVTLAVRQWGPAAGGWLAGLPLVGGPVLVFYAIEQGPAFAAAAARGTMAAMAANAVYCVLYSRLARALPWHACVAVGWATFALFVVAIEAARPNLLVSFALPVAAALISVRLLPPAEPVPAPARQPKADLLTRIVASGALVVTLTSLAARLGPAWSGLLAGFPLITTTVAAFTHVQRGPAAVLDFFRGFVPAIIGFVVYCVVFAVAVERVSVAVAVVAALTVQLVIHGTLVRRLTPPPSATATLPT